MTVSLVNALTWVAGQPSDVGWPDWTTSYAAFDVTAVRYANVGWTSADNAGSATITVDWGDGATSSLSQPNAVGVAQTSHTYTTPGPYTVTITVTASDGSASTTKTAYTPTIAVAQIASLLAGYRSILVTFTGFANQVNPSWPGNTQAKWQFGDGSGGGPFNFSQHPAPETFNHLYPTRAPYTFQIWGYDAAGGTWKGTAVIRGAQLPLRQHPRDDALGGAPRQARASRSVQSSTRQGWTGAYR